MSGARRPVVGVCAALERARWTVWDTEANLSPRSYSVALSAAGAQTVILPADDGAIERADQVLDLLDGLLLAGGGDIGPELYGEPRRESTAIRPERDRLELALCRAAIERDMPLLGICRGFEMLNVALGGTLVQEIETARSHLAEPGAFTTHEVELEPGSLAARAAGAERISVRSHHHQGAGELGRDLIVSGRAVEDGLVEAIELADWRFALGVLWHTEEESPSPVIESLVEAARTEAAVVQ